MDKANWGDNAGLIVGGRVKSLLNTIMTSQESEAFELAVEQAWPAAEWRDVHVVLAVSGGPDSVALLRAALAIKGRAGGRGRIHLAHLNHGLRGTAAAADQAWLAALCRPLGVPLEVAHTDVSALAAEQGDGWEAAARTARFDFLRDTAERLGARFVAVGHTADDQVETVLHRLIRGTGVAGLAGMPATRPLAPTVALVRPLLGVGRREVLAYLDAIGQGYCRDVTNDEPRFTRNRLRHQLLPLLRSDFNPDVDRAVLRLAKQAGELQQAIGRIADELVTRCVNFERAPAADVASKPNANAAAAPVAELRIDCRLLADQPPVVVREVCKAAWSRAGWPLQEMGFDQWQQIACLATGDAAVAPVNLPGGIRGQRLGTTLHLRLVPAEP